MRRFVSNGAVAGIAIVFTGCSPPDPDNLEVRTQAISNGQMETNYPAVGCLQDTINNRICSGTLIAPNLVLSAKHCAPMDTFNTGDFCSTTTGPQVPNVRTIDYAIKYVAGEDPVVWTDPDLYPNDLAIYHLSSPIYNVRPLQVNALGYPGDGTNCVAVGYGLDGVGGSATKRSATVSVQWSGELIYGHDGVGYTLMSSAIEVAPGPGGSSPPPGLPESGDSGSPLLCNGEGVIKGVYAGNLYYPWFTDKYYTALDNGNYTASSAWVTNVAANYINEPMVSVTSWGTNRFDLFVRGTDGAIYTKTWDSTQPLNWDNSHWYPSQFGWNYLGGFITGTPEAISWGSNRIDIFMRAGDPDPRTDSYSSMTLWRLYWNGSSWNWQQVGTAGLASHPSAVTWGVNRLDVFALVSTGYIAHYYSSNGGQNWFSELVPTDGGPTTFLPTMKAFSTSSGSLDLYAVGTDSVPYHNHYDSYGVWSGWQSLGGWVMGTPAVTTWGGGRQDIFFKGTDTNLYHKVLTGGSFLPSQTDWDFLGGPITGSPAAASMQLNWLTLIAHGEPGDTEGLAYKGWFNGSQWAPTNTTWYDLNGLANGPPTLVGVPGIGVNAFSVGVSYSPGISAYTPNGPQPYGFTGFGPLGGIISW